MKLTRYIQIIVIIVLVLMLSGLSQAWNQHRYHRYQRHYGHRDSYQYRYQYEHNRSYTRHQRLSPYGKNYRHPRDTHQYSQRYRKQYTMDDGWRLIKKGQSHRALDIFGDLAKSNPGASGPKVGYAIAAADMNRLSKGVWAMRRAFQYGPSVFHGFELDGRFEGKLKRLVSKYQGRSHGLPEKDAYFMQASLYYLLEDKNACFEAINRSKAVNDYSVSAKNLYNMAENYL